MNNFPFDTGHTLRRLLLKQEYRSERQAIESAFVNDMLRIERTFAKDRLKRQEDYSDDMYLSALRLQEELTASRRMAGLCE